MRAALATVLLLCAAACDDSGRMTAAPHLSPVAEAVSPNDCIRWSTAELRSDLVQVAAGRPDVRVDVPAQLISEVGGGSPLVERVDRVLEVLLRTATADLLGRYERNVEAELEGYRLLISQRCSR